MSAGRRGREQVDIEDDAGITITVLQEQVDDLVNPSGHGIAGPPKACRRRFGEGHGGLMGEDPRHRALDGIACVEGHALHGLEGTVWLADTSRVSELLGVGDLRRHHHDITFHDLPL